MDTYEPKTSFRWYLNIPGIPPYLITRVMSLADDKMMIEMYWLRDDQSPAEPTEKSGILKFLDPEDKVTDTFDISFEKHENLPIDLDYADSHGMKPKVLLHGVSLRRV